jgi:tetratricopeptide (TPR) repeat protein
MENSEYIEKYHSNELSEVEKIEFEQKIINDKYFAADLAFYYSVLETAKNELNQEKKNRFREIYAQDAGSRAPAGIRKMWTSIAAAAAFVVIVLGAYFLFNGKPVSTEQLADRFIKENFQDLHVTMGGNADNEQLAIDLYNQGKYQEALQAFQKIMLADTADYNAVQYAGIAALQLKNYDWALKYFNQLSSYILRVNPGKFYKAVTLMKRDQPGDAGEAKQLLTEIMQTGLEGSGKAKDWLKAWSSK